ncbi:MAG: GNAT family N-acetyltransferase [Candidatus Peribacteraceae bacterium]|jgi:ribosomal protein S18 acetylase RimI-like enzyme
MNPSIHIVPASLKDILLLVEQVEEFAEAGERTEEEYRNKIGNAKFLCLIGYLNKKPAGFFIGYDRYQDGSFYCWRVGVLPAFRRKGLLRSLMHYAEKWSVDQGFQKIKLITRNSRRPMLSYLITENYHFTEIILKETIDDNRIRAEKQIIAESHNRTLEATLVAQTVKRATAMTAIDRKEKYSVAH